MIVYLRGRPLSLLSVVDANIPLRLPLRNAIRQSAIYRRSIAASVPLLPAKAREEAGGLLLLRPQRCTVAAVVPLLPAKARKGPRAWLLLRPLRCTVAAVLPLLPVKAEKGAGAWLLLRPLRCTVAAVVPLLPVKAGKGARGWLLRRRQGCTVAAAVVSYERFRKITMTFAVLRWRPRDTRRARLRLVPSSSASFATDSRSRAAVMWPQLLWLRTKQMLRWWMTVPLNSSSSLIICLLDRLIS